MGERRSPCLHPLLTESKVFPISNFKKRAYIYQRKNLPIFQNSSQHKHTSSNYYTVSMSMARSVLAALLLWFSVAPWLTAGAGELLMAAPPPPAAGQDCRRRCGEVDIPFPFGYGPSHCRLPGFLIQCNDTGNGVFKPFLGTMDVEIVNISLTTGQVTVLNNISSYCYDASSRTMKPSEWRWNVRGTPFTFSDTDNKFTVLGCRVLAYIGDSYEAAMYTTGCVATCRPDDPAALTNGSCSGMGCCQTDIPKGLQFYHVWFDERFNTSDPLLRASRGPCTYAVLMESSNFTFSTSYVTPSSDLVDQPVPVVLDWVVSDDRNCRIAPTRPESACVSSNSSCFRAPSGQGYICNCTEGFEGNPYIPDGCRDINECNDPTKCFGDCFNKNGTFTCSCPKGYQGNASIKDGCQIDPFPFPLRARIAVGSFVGLLVALLAFLATEVILNKRSNKRQGYFEQHGGQLLSEILKREGIINFTFFDRGDIVKATSSFRKANIIGEGAHGAVYKAKDLNIGGNTTTAAVKRCKKIEKTRTDEFVRELVILCRMSHPNIVKLLGCCLHFEAPLLVYEFMQHGTLNDLLHGKDRRCVTLATRLRIAAETAEALTHLHSSPHPTLHGDMKPENILLGDSWVAKVSDFGCSTIDDNLQVVPKGTLAYLDPELLKSFQISEKSDAYSFGVVLMELLTRRRPLAKEQKNLTIIFHESMGNRTLSEILDPDIILEAEGAIAMRVIHQAAELAIRCTTVPSITRPSMRQVAEELRRLSNEMLESTEALQALEGSGYTSYAATESGTTTTEFYTIGNITALSTELAR